MFSKKFSKCTRKVNQFIGAFSVAFLLIMTLVIPIFTRQEPVTAPSGDPPEPFLYDEFIAPVGDELLDKRTRSSKTFDLGNNKFSWDGTVGSIHYKDNPKNESEQWKEIDNIFKSALAPWNWEMLDASYHIGVKEDFTSGQIIEFEVQGVIKQYSVAGVKPVGVPVVSNQRVSHKLGAPIGAHRGHWCCLSLVFVVVYAIAKHFGRGMVVIGNDYL